MSFKCDRCSRQVPRFDEKGKALEPRTPNRVVSKIRKTGGTGWEIVEEIDVCPECLPEVTPTTVNPEPAVLEGTVGEVIAKVWEARS